MREIFEYFRDKNTEKTLLHGESIGNITDRNGVIYFSPEDLDLRIFSKYPQDLSKYVAQFKIKGKHVYASINMDNISDEMRITVGNVWEKCLLSAA